MVHLETLLWFVQMVDQLATDLAVIGTAGSGRRVAPATGHVGESFQLADGLGVRRRKEIGSYVYETSLDPEAGREVVLYLWCDSRSTSVPAVVWILHAHQRSILAAMTTDRVVRRRLDDVKGHRQDTGYG
ncbi:MAG: hypothetical protein AABZ53_17150 [Planctomycetota bacterium]